VKSTIPTLHCDHESGCPEWTPDWYELTCSNWRDLLDGWDYDPYRDPDASFCPEHSRKIAGHHA
jgi:hypothetical protein